jgi:hypothetical protein
MRITESTLRKIIREELDAAMSEQDMKIGSMEGDLDPEFTRRLNRVSRATRMILRRAGMAEKDLSPVQVEALPNLAARVADGELSPEKAADHLRDAKRPMQEAVENEMLFNLVKDAGIPMMNVDRKAFFNFLRARDLTSAAAIEDNRGMIVAWLRRNR